MVEVLRADEISKAFPGVLAVDRVSFGLERGEILALVGENGAGKSTLMQMLGGALRPESGRILLEGKPVGFASPEDAIRAGISMVFQELSMVGSLSVAENIFANRQPVGPLNNIRWRELYRQTLTFLRDFDVRIDPRLPVKHLPMGQQQMLEILKAISTSPKVLILDEPTSSLTEAETASLFSSIRKLQDRGMSFIYITHKLFEVFKIASRVLVLRDGKFIGSRMVGEVTENDLVGMMVGRQITNMYGEAGPKRTGEPLFTVQGFSRRGAFRDVHLELRRGEILGLAGLVGAHRTEIARSIFGADPTDSGTLVLDGQQVVIHQPQDAIRRRIAYLTEDRKALGLFLTMAVAENLVAPALRSFAGRTGFIHWDRMGRHARQQVDEYAIATPSTAQKVLNLSGGNQQKLLLAMWMGIRPEVIIFDEPTRGVDVGARADIYKKLREFADRGSGIIIISSDTPELIGMCDRIVVIHDGRVAWEVPRARFNEAEILAHAAGIHGLAPGEPSNRNAVRAGGPS